MLTSGTGHGRDHLGRAEITGRDHLGRAEITRAEIVEGRDHRTRAGTPTTTKNPVQPSARVFCSFM